MNFELPKNEYTCEKCGAGLSENDTVFLTEDKTEYLGCIYCLGMETAGGYYEDRRTK